MHSAEIALAVKTGELPKAKISSKEIRYYYYGFTVQDLKYLVEPEQDTQQEQEGSQSFQVHSKEYVKHFQRDEERIMPLPKPKKNEKRSEYVSRFMSNDRMKEEYPSQDQRTAVAYSKWRKSKRESKK